MEQNTKLYKMKKLTAFARLTFGLILLSFFTGSITAQVSTLKLSTNTSSSYFDITDNSDISLFRLRGDGKLGINQGTPLAGLHLVSDEGLLVQSTITNGSTLDLGAGTRMHWYPKKAAFRVGYINGTQWDDANMGNYSFASGKSTTASGDYSVAMGDLANASGSSSFAMGFNVLAGGGYSIAIGSSTNATGFATTAIGYMVTASGGYSHAIGNYISTNSKYGSFIIGDRSTASITGSSADNQMMMRFAGGYILYTSNDLSTYAFLDPNQTTWNTSSDSTKKYAFLPVDGESVLKKIGTFNLRTWSYKGQDSTKFRHYGPMAQEFFDAFGKDKYGVAGNDTTINQGDFDGINLIAIQALIKRTNELRKKTDELRIAQGRVEELENDLTSQNDKISNLEEQLSFQNELIKKLISEFKSVKDEIIKLREEKRNYSVSTVLLNSTDNDVTEINK